MRKKAEAPVDEAEDHGTESDGAKSWARLPTFAYHGGIGNTQQGTAALARMIGQALCQMAA